MKHTHNSLSVVILDDDPVSVLYLKHLIKVTKSARIAATFNSPQKFLEVYEELNFDVLLLDWVMPVFSGKEIIKTVGGEHCIVNTESNQFYEQAIKCHPIDILIKPVAERHLLGALNKARKLKINNSKYNEPIESYTSAKEFALFHTNEGEANVLLKDILFVRTIKSSHGNLEMFLKPERKLLLKGYAIEYILEIADFLLQPNQSELVSNEAVDIIEHNLIHLKEVCDKSKQITIKLSRHYRENFLSHIPSA